MPRIEPIRITPARNSQYAPNVPPTTVNTISSMPNQSSCGALAHGRTNGVSTKPDMTNMMPLTARLPHRATSLAGRIDSAAVHAASARPHSNPTSGSFSVERSPPVAISTVPVNANATPMLSRSPGQRRPRMHTYASTNSRFNVCNTVAVPEFVQSIADRYETCTNSTQVSAASSSIG